jgi:hypothetical protein
VDRLKLEHPRLAHEFYERVLKVVPTQLEFTEEDKDLGPFLVGRWNFVQINERISFLRYNPGGVFERHRDGIYVYHEDKRSIMTILIYLNDSYEAGRTAVFTDDLSFEHHVAPVPGSAVCMS